VAPVAALRRPVIGNVPASGGATCELGGMSIAKKIVALVVVPVLFAALTAVGYHVLVVRVRDMATRHASELMLQDYRNELKDLVDAMASTLAAATEGDADEGEAYRVYSGLLKDARFFADKSGYYFVYKAGGTVFVLPTLQDLEGQNIIDRLDPKGTPFIRLLDQVARGGGGYVEYWFNKPGKGVLPKLSYARMIPGTQYWIGTGVYVDDVQERQTLILGEIRESTSAFLWRLYLVVGNAFLVIMIPLVVALVLSIIRPIRELTAVADSFSKGQLDLKVPGTERRDEIGSLARALGRLGISIRGAMERLEGR
jgi:methyl-accepting chemotaxis protein